jgi:phospholipid/cholesterol/gamma-HCH transport system substrate-binding protein
MMKRLEFSVGFFMLIGLICLSYLTVKLGKLEVFSSDGYTVQAKFSSVSGLKTGASVEISGVPVGKVTSIALNSNYVAVVDLLLDKNIAITDDSIASIKTSGLIGDKYISISNGGSEELITQGGVIAETEPSLDIESLLSKYVFGAVK